MPPYPPPPSASSPGVVRGPRLEKILEDDELKKYRKGLERHARIVESLVQPGSEKKAYHLADALDALLNDKGKDLLVRVV